MKKFFALMGAIVFALGALALAGCAGTAGETQGRSIVCTVFAEYDWVRAVLGEQEERFDVKLLQDSGTDMHSYQPTVADVASISTCDLFIYVGGESDGWVEGALQGAQNTDREVLCLFDALEDRLLEEEELEGAEEGEHDHDHEHAADEHIWLSLRNAQAAVQAIADRLGALDPAYADTYAANAAAYCDKLSALDARYAETVAAAPYDSVLFGDRFPFLYLMHDYGLHYYAAFSGCSADSEASFATIAFLAEKVDELGLPAILTIEGSGTNIAATIRDNTADKDQLILTMDSLQSVTRKDIEAGASYLGAMEQNLSVLAQAQGTEAK